MGRGRLVLAAPTFRKREKPLIESRTSACFHISIVNQKPMESLRLTRESWKVMSPGIHVLLHVGMRVPLFDRRFVRFPLLFHRYQLITC
jgi:hypothetical protein